MWIWLYQIDDYNEKNMSYFGPKLLPYHIPLNGYNGVISYKYLWSCRVRNNCNHAFKQIECSRKL